MTSGKLQSELSRKLQPGDLVAPVDREFDGTHVYRVIDKPAPGVVRCAKNGKEVFLMSVRRAGMLRWHDGTGEWIKLQ